MAVVIDKNKLKNILVVDDEASIREMLRLTLTRENYHVYLAEDTTIANELIRKHSIDLILLDWMLPKESGIEFTLKLRQQDKFKSLPIIMLTAKADDEDMLSGFNVGVDDYIRKPFAINELLARIKSILRLIESTTQDNYNSGESDVLSLAGIQLDKTSHLVCDNNHHVIHLGPTEFKLLLFLMKNPNRVYSRDQLLDYVWGETVYIDERTVDVHIRRLRKALESSQLDHVIRTVRGSGYSFTTLST